MSESLPTIYLARHGETAWTISGQHTGRSDIPLTERGERNARRLGERLNGLSFAKVLTSPLQRARRTCELAGFGNACEVDSNLLEWDYGEIRRQDQRGRSTNSRRTGTCSAMAAPAAKPRVMSPPAPIVSSRKSAACNKMC
jgi:broad specificity phosphatase PhoE